MEMLHYVEDADTVFCHGCAKTYKERKLTGGNFDLALIFKGYSNWKDT